MKYLSPLGKSIFIYFALMLSVHGVPNTDGDIQGVSIIIGSQEDSPTEERESQSPRRTLRSQYSETFVDQMDQNLCAPLKRIINLEIEQRDINSTQCNHVEIPRSCDQDNIPSEFTRSGQGPESLQAQTRCFQAMYSCHYLNELMAHHDAAMADLHMIRGVHALLQEINNQLTSVAGIQGLSPDEAERNPALRGRSGRIQGATEQMISRGRRPIRSLQNLTRRIRQYDFLTGMSGGQPGRFQMPQNVSEDLRRIYPNPQESLLNNYEAYLRQIESDHRSITFSNYLRVVCEDTQSNQQTEQIQNLCEIVNDPVHHNEDLSSLNGFVDGYLRSDRDHTSEVFNRYLLRSREGNELEGSQREDLLTSIDNNTQLIENGFSCLESNQGNYQACRDSLSEAETARIQLQQIQREYDVDGVQELISRSGRLISELNSQDQALASRGGAALRSYLNQMDFRHDNNEAEVQSNIDYLRRRLNRLSDRASCRRLVAGPPFEPADHSDCLEHTPDAFRNLFGSLHREVSLNNVPPQQQMASKLNALFACEIPRFPEGYEGIESDRSFQQKRDILECLQNNHTRNLSSLVTRAQAKLDAIRRMIQDIQHQQRYRDLENQKFDIFTDIPSGTCNVARSNSGQDCLGTPEGSDANPLDNLVDSSGRILATLSRNRFGEQLDSNEDGRRGSSSSGRARVSGSGSVVSGEENRITLVRPGDGDGPNASGFTPVPGPALNFEESDQHCDVERDRWGNITYRYNCTDRRSDGFYVTMGLLQFGGLAVTSYLQGEAAYAMAEGYYYQSQIPNPAPAGLYPASSAWGYPGAYPWTTGNGSPWSSVYTYGLNPPGASFFPGQTDPNVWAAFQGGNAYPMYYSQNPSATSNARNTTPGAFDFRG